MSRLRMFTLIMRLACLGLIVSLAGCSEAKFGEVSGRVTLDNKPLPNIAVRFQDEGGSATIAKTDADGKYTLRFSSRHPGAPVGKHKVTIFTPPPVSEGTGTRAVNEIVPAKYNKNSTETREVKPGVQVIDFDLQSK